MIGFLIGQLLFLTVIVWVAYKVLGIIVYFVTPLPKVSDDLSATERSKKLAPQPLPFTFKQFLFAAVLAFIVFQIVMTVLYGPA